MSSTFHGLVEAEVDPNTEVSVREAAHLQSIGDEQGFVKSAVEQCSLFLSINATYGYLYRDDVIECIKWVSL